MNQNEKKHLKRKVEKNTEKDVFTENSLVNGSVVNIFDLGHLPRRTEIQKDKNKAKAFIKYPLKSNSIIGLILLSVSISKTLEIKVNENLFSKVIFGLIGPRVVDCHYCQGDTGLIFWTALLYSLNKEPNWR